jgi:hydroxyethylthiazole kinase-like uncharacterized protein yjeF
MQRILPITHDVALFDPSHARAIEQREAVIAHKPSLMQRAGEAVAKLALAIAPHADRIWIAAGPGNNGGDGLEAATHLLRWGKRVEVSLVGDPSALPRDAQAAFARATAAGVQVATTVTEPTEPPQLAIDALLGIGASRPPLGLMADRIRNLNALSCDVLAVDLPSGLNPRTGQPFGDVCVVATHTLAMLTLQPGLFTGAGRDHAGAIWLDTLNVDGPPDVPTAWLSGVTAEGGLRPRRHAQHKGSFGDVAVVGGATGMTGAALMSACAAHAAGAGRVFVQLLDRSPNAPTIDLNRPELMFRHDWSLGAPESLARSTVVCGCGASLEVRTPLPRLLSLAHRLVLDADALNVVSADASLASLLRARAPRGQATVITPHPLEAARLLSCSTSEVQSDRLHAAFELAKRFGCVVVLKGSGTVIAANAQVPRINSTGNAALATAGTGDVLAGWLGGRWSQRGSGDEAAIAFAAARQAVAEHGAAAEPQPSGSVRAADLIERLHLL